MIELGALWKKNGQKGEYFTGQFGKATLLIFKNDKKTLPNQPDFRVYIGEKAKPTQKPEFNANINKEIKDTVKQMVKYSNGSSDIGLYRPTFGKFKGKPFNTINIQELRDYAEFIKRTASPSKFIEGFLSKVEEYENYIGNQLGPIDTPLDEIPF